MDPRIEDYQANAALFTAVVDATIAWDGQSPCREWSTADVLDHVVDTQRDFLMKRGATLAALPDGPPATRWHAHLDGVRRLVTDEAFTFEEYDGYFGRTTVADTLSSFYGFDMLVHRWDLARGAGSDVEFSDDELDRIEQSAKGFGEALYSQGVCGPPVEVPGDAPRQERMLGVLGRRV